MARGRMLNKSICLSKKFQELPDDTTRLLATWIIPHLDVQGVFYADPAVVKAMVFPRRVDLTIDDIQRALDAMIDAGLIVIFQAKDDIWQVWPGFTDNQVGMRADRETTDFPQPPDATETPLPHDDGDLPDDCRNDAGYLPDDGGNDSEKSPQKRREVNRIESNDAASPAAAASDRLTEGQRYFLDAFGAKRFRTNAQRDAVLQMEEQYSTATLREAVDWAAKRGMNIGAAVVSIEKAIPKWGKSTNGKVVLGR